MPLKKRRKTVPGRSPSKPRKKISRILSRLRFQNPQWFEAALTHPSYRHENPILSKLENFDRLEFFGDAILNFVICKKIYALFPDADEGILSRLRSILVSRKILYKAASLIGLPHFTKLGKSLSKQKAFLKGKIYADSFEALLAALYFDRGFDFTEQFILKIFKDYFDAKRLLRLDPNPKSALQELAQKFWQMLPIYKTESTSQGSLTTVSIQNFKEASALGRTRKESEQKAARLLVRFIRQELADRLKKNSSERKFRKTR